MNVIPQTYPMEFTMNTTVISRSASSGGDELVRCLIVGWTVSEDRELLPLMIAYSLDPSEPGVIAEERVPTLIEDWKRGDHRVVRY